MSHDLRLGPDCLLILGTSLKVHGLKNLVKEFARAVHSKKDGKVIFVNLSPPSESSWKGTIDYWIETKCDTWAQDKFREKQTRIPFKARKKNDLPPAISQKEGKENRGSPKKAYDGTSTQNINTSPTKTLDKALPTPPPSRKRRILGEVAPSASLNGHFVQGSVDSRTPSKGRAEVDDTETLYPSGSYRQPVILITPRSDASTPRKRRKVREDFAIFDSEEDNADEKWEIAEELSREMFSSPSARGRKRKLIT